MTLEDLRYWLNPFIIRNNIRYHYEGIMAERDIKPGDFYEDCGYHPVVCTKNDRGDLEGVSLIDSSHPRGCSYFHCGPRKLTAAEAFEIKKNWHNQDKVDWNAQEQA